MATGLRARSKYNAQATIVDQIRFDSKSEAYRYRELKLMQRAGEIERLHVHPMFYVRWPQSDEKICGVELDFQYADKNGVTHYEDVKGFDTALSKLKRKLVEAAFKIKVDVIK